MTEDNRQVQTQEEKPAAKKKLTISQINGILLLLVIVAVLAVSEILFFSSADFKSTIIAILLSVYREFGNIVAVASLLVAIWVGSVFERSEKEERRKKTTKIILTVLIVVIFSFGILFAIQSRFTIVPDVYGLTYDKAMETLQDSGLDGQLLLASTNDDLLSGKQRVIWQSLTKNKADRKGSKVYFVIDDSFSTESLPLKAYWFVREYEHNPSAFTEADQPFEYRIDYNDAIKMSVCAEKGESSFKELSKVNEGHWNITIQSPKEYTEFISTVEKSGKTVVVADSYISLATHNSRMSDTLLSIIEESKNVFSVSVGSKIAEDDIRLVAAKLSSQNTGSAENLYVNGLKDGKGVILMPYDLTAGEYVLSFSFIDQTGHCFEWYHNISIEETD